MRILFNLVIATALLTLNSCDPKDKDVQFGLDYTQTFTWPATFGIEYPTSTSNIIIETDSEDGFENNETTSELVDQVVLNRLQIAITEPAEGNFDFVDDITIYISTSDLAEIKVGDEADLAAGTRQFLFNLESVDVADYLKSSTLTFRIEFTSDEYAGEDLKCSILSAFTVNGTKA